MEEGAKVGVGNKESVHPESQVRELEKGWHALSRFLVGKPKRWRP
jgi:hypothetical protein